MDFFLYFILLVKNYSIQPHTCNLVFNSDPWSSDDFIVLAPALNLYPEKTTPTSITYVL